MSNSYIAATYTKKISLLFEIIAGDERAATSTDNTISDGEEIWEVNSYLVSGIQKAVLRKVE